MWRRAVSDDDDAEHLMGWGHTSLDIFKDNVMMSVLMGRVFLFSDSLQHKMSDESLFIANKRVINLQTQFHDEILWFIDFKNRACKAVCSPARSLGGEVKTARLPILGLFPPLGVRKRAQVHF